MRGIKSVRFVLTADLLLGISAALCSTHARADAPAPKTSAASEHAKTWRDVSMDDYRSHLLALVPIVEACAKARDTKVCDPMLVGPDDRVSLPTGYGGHPERRLVRYGWLRVLLSKAQDADEPPPRPVTGSQAFPSLVNARPPRRTTTELLKDAEARLARDLAEANAPAAAQPDHAQEREVLRKVLAGREFRDLDDASIRNSVLEKILNAINRSFNRVAGIGARSAWIGRILVWGFLGAICVGLVWGLLQLERRWRIRLVPENGGPAPGAASARDWQLWLEDARRAAAQGNWREAVHFVYWASISRLESRRLWPADRACTPREYLGLLAPEDPRRPGLAALTGSFERIWYGGRPALEQDYRKAEQLASALISASGAPSGSAP
jgi:hypothetical protein